MRFLLNDVCSSGIRCQISPGFCQKSAVWSLNPCLRPISVTLWTRLLCWDAPSNHSYSITLELRVIPIFIQEHTLSVWADGFLISCSDFVMLFFKTQPSLSSVSARIQIGSAQSCMPALVYTVACTEIPCLTLGPSFLLQVDSLDLLWTLQLISCCLHRFPVLQCFLHPGCLCVQETSALRFLLLLSDLCSNLPTIRATSSYGICCGSSLNHYTDTDELRLLFTHHIMQQRFPCPPMTSCSFS